MGFAHGRPSEVTTVSRSPSTVVTTAEKTTSVADPAVHGWWKQMCATKPLTWFELVVRFE